MTSDCCEEELPGPSPSALTEAESAPGVRLYQAATLMVILLFLLSFWSC